MMRKTAVKIVKNLQDEGFEAYFAGGYVRDMLLGIESKDIDIVTSATPDQVEKIFTKTVPIGKQFGIILVVQDEKKYEVATFRRESDYLDRRRPSKITFSDAKTDATRRDFTINGLFFDPVSNKVIDFVSGADDIKRKTIRFIGNPQERISEDNLRLVRAIRLKITLGFQYAPDTFEAVRKNSHLIKNVSAERLRDELNRIMASPNRHQALVELSESSLLKFIIPEIEALKGVPQPIQYHHEGDVFTHTYLALKSLNDRTPSHLAWAVLLHDIAKPLTLTHIKNKIVFHNHAEISAELAKKILERLKFPRFEIFDICWLIENHMKIGIIEKMRPGKRLNFVLDPKFNDLIELARADSSGTYPVNLDIVKRLEQAVKSALLWRDKTSSRHEKALITGDDLIELGFEPGSKFKEILEGVDDLHLSGELSSKKEALDYIIGKFK